MDQETYDNRVRGVDAMTTKDFGQVRALLLVCDLLREVIEEMKELRRAVTVTRK